jgi:hypothetical protein
MSISLSSKFPLTSDFIKRQERKRKREEEYRENRAKAYEVARKFLEQNTDINVGCLVECLNELIIPTIRCAEKLGISPGAFLRLRKKYNITPVYTIRNDKTLNSQPIRKTFAPKSPKLSVKNFYTEEQLKRIPKEEIELVQLRAARSLKFPNGKNEPFKWERRGKHSNGKLKPRIDALIRSKFHVEYHAEADRYSLKKNNEVCYADLSRKEVDRLNFKYNRMEVFT